MFVYKYAVSFTLHHTNKQTFSVKVIYHCQNKNSLNVADKMSAHDVSHWHCKDYTI